MTENELKELLEKLEEQGWRPLLCDTPVPYFENAVPCGKPEDVGGVQGDVQMWPKALLSIQSEFVVKVKGDSMKDANIEAGDEVKVQTNALPRDGDIVLVAIDGEITLKTYCEDEDGRPWLVPQNDAYEAFQLSEKQNVEVCGVVKEVIKTAPRVTSRACMKAINRARQKRFEPKVITPQQVSHTIREVAPMVKTARQWYAVYRPMAEPDLKVVAEGDFETFCKMVATEVPEHEHLPSCVELQRMAVQSFAKPVVLWRPDNAPVKGKRFVSYQSIAQRTRELLEE